MTWLFDGPEKLYIDLLGKPYERDARGPQSYDCLGLFIEIERRLGRCLEGYQSTPGQLTLALGPGGAWEKVTGAAQRGDGVLLRGEDRDWHVGCVLRPGLMIHCRAGAGVLIERYDDGGFWSRRVEGVYRWKD